MNLLTKTTFQDYICHFYSMVWTALPITAVHRWFIGDKLRKPWKVYCWWCAMLVELEMKKKNNWSIKPSIQVWNVIISSTLLKRQTNQKRSEIILCNKTIETNTITERNMKFITNLECIGGTKSKLACKWTRCTVSNTKAHVFRLTFNWYYTYIYLLNL